MDTKDLKLLYYIDRTFYQENLKKHLTQEVFLIKFMGDLDFLREQKLKM